ncbi:hypothetical protein Zmor_022057 [Zophobas morio]|uniref:Gustatory receptor n=1 Tax=Zophobas morio TaxID=2755281 RepID=A0AA38MBK9_9CUCU|nr:hypothetical protein Zmor_022057 [Zophobas morio]
MKSTNNDIAQIVQPIFVLWKFTGLPIYKLTSHSNGKETRFVKTDSKTVYPAVLLLSCLYFLCSTNTISEITDSAIVDEFMNFVELTTFFVQNIVILVVCHIKRKQILRVFEQLQFSENCVQKLKKHKSCYIVGVKRTVLKLATMKYSFIVILYVVYSINVPDDRINLIAYFCSWCFHYHFEMLIVTYLLILKNQYREINQFLVYQKFELDYLNVKEVISLHQVLRNTCKLIKDTFQGLILVKVIADSIITSTAVFYVLRVYLLLPENFLLSSVSNVVFAILIAVSNFTVAFVFHDLVEQVDI